MREREDDPLLQRPRERGRPAHGHGGDGGEAAASAGGAEGQRGRDRGDEEVDCTPLLADGALGDGEGDAAARVDLAAVAADAAPGEGASGDCGPGDGEVRGRRGRLAGIDRAGHPSGGLSAVAASSAVGGDERGPLVKEGVAAAALLAPVVAVVVGEDDHGLLVEVLAQRPQLREEIGLGRRGAAGNESPTSGLVSPDAAPSAVGGLVRVLPVVVAVGHGVAERVQDGGAAVVGPAAAAAAAVLAQGPGGGAAAAAVAPSSRVLVVGGFASWKNEQKRLISTRISIGSCEKIIPSCLWFMTGPFIIEREERIEALSNCRPDEECR